MDREHALDLDAAVLAELGEERQTFGTGLGPGGFVADPHTQTANEDGDLRPLLTDEPDAVAKFEVEL